MVIDLVAGQVKFGFVTSAGMMDHVQAGRLKALGVARASRSPLAPEVPTIAESGYPGFRVENYSVMLAPAGIPEFDRRTLGARSSGGAQAPRHYRAIARDGHDTGWNDRSRSSGPAQGRPGSLGKGRRDGQHAPRLKARVTPSVERHPPTKACHVRNAPISRNNAHEWINSGGDAWDRNAASRSKLCRAGDRRRS